MPVDELSTFVCDACGYPRTGLPAEGRCPECGAAPPELVSGDRPLENRLPQTVAERTRWRLVAVGLVLLIYCWINGMRVTFVEDMGALTLAAINVPAPKVPVGAMIERFINGRPGEWGVAGFMAGLGGLLALWLITEPAVVADRHESTFSLRRLTRWYATIAIGTCAGVFVVLTPIYVAADIDGRWVVSLSLLLGEAVPAALLYAWLRSLAIQVNDRRTAQALMKCMGWVPGVMGLGVAIFGFKFDLEGLNKWVFRALAGSYMALAISVGMYATAAMARLMISLWRVAWGTSLYGFFKGAAGGWIPNRSLLKSLQRQQWRLWVTAGIFLWVKHTSDFTIYDSFQELGRYGLLMFIYSWVPKVASHTEYFFPRSFEYLGLVAVWLITWKPPLIESRGNRIVRMLARWVVTVVCGFDAGANFYTPTLRFGSEAQRWAEMRLSLVCASMNGLASAVVYFYFSRLARMIEPRRLATGLCVFAALCLLPIAFVFVPNYTLNHTLSRPVGTVVGLVACPLLTALGMMSLILLLRLALSLIGQVIRDAPLATSHHPVPSVA